MRARDVCRDRGLSVLPGRRGWILFLCFLTGAVAAGEPRTEYYERLAKIPPRSADAYVELGLWCRQVHLEEKAVECFQQAISIDADCEKARTELGYRRHGTSWIKEGEAAKPRAAPPRSKATSTKSGSESTGTTQPPAPQVAEKAPVKEPSGTTVTSSAEKIPPVSPKTEAEPKQTAAGSDLKEAELSASEVEKKKAWAKTAGEKLRTVLATYEDEDFLVHTTFSSSSGEMKRFVGNLKLLRKTLGVVLGATSSTKIWPDKLQMVLLKSEPEFVRFAETVDGLKAVKTPDGAYTQANRTVIWNLDTPAIPRLLGSSALTRLNGSDKYVGWWLSQGLAEFCLAQSPLGIQKNHYRDSMKAAAAIMKAEGQALRIFNLIEAPDYKVEDLPRVRALSFSLVEFLAKKSRRGFQDVVGALKSEKAPAPPLESTSSEEFRAFFNSSYISFQEEALRSAFRVPVETLGEQWRAYVTTTAASLKDTQPQQDTNTKKAAAKGKRGG